MDNRTEDRSNVFLAGAVDCGAAPVPVRIRNVSSRGALIDGKMLPSVGARVRLLRGSLSAWGTLAWQGDGQAGINFDEPIVVQDWVRRTGHSGQQRVDGIVAAIRSKTETGEIDDLAAPEFLASISLQLDQLCERFAEMESFPLEFGEDLLKLDAIAQSLRKLSGRRDF